MWMLGPLIAVVGCGSGSVDVGQPPGSDVGTAVIPTTPTVPSFYVRVPNNVLMISMDTFRKDHLGRYGGGFTPFLDELVEQGFALDDHQQCSNWTYASTTCTLLGRYNLDAGFMPKLSSAGREPVPDGTPFLATWLADAGYYTILVSSNSWLSEEWGNDQGYLESELPDNRNATNCYEHGLERLEGAIAAGADPWFLHLHFKEPHPAYDPPDDYLAALDDLPPVAWDLGAYDAHYDSLYAYDGLSDADRALLEAHLRVRYEGEVRYLFDDLDDRGLLDDTLVVFWTDHGEQFWEHGDQGHAYALTGEENDGLAFFWSKGIVPGVWSEPTVSIDLAPTLLSLMGQPVPAEMTGKVLGEADARRPRYAASEARIGPVQSVTQEGWKLQFWWSGELDLYDRRLDPHETQDQYAEGHPMVAELWPLLESRVELMEPLVPEDDISWPPFSTHAP